MLMIITATPTYPQQTSLLTDSYSTQEGEVVDQLTESFKADENIHRQMFYFNLNYIAIAKIF